MDVENCEVSHKQVFHKENELEILPRNVMRVRNEEILFHRLESGSNNGGGARFIRASSHWVQNFQRETVKLFMLS